MRFSLTAAGSPKAAKEMLTKQSIELQRDKDPRTQECVGNVCHAAIRYVEDLEVTESVSLSVSFDISHSGERTAEATSEGT